MKISLKMIYLLHLCLDSNQTSIAILKDNLESLLYFGDLDPIFKVTSQLTKVYLIDKNEIFLEQMDGYSSNFSGYIVVTDLRRKVFDDLDPIFKVISCM